MKKLDKVFLIGAVLTVVEFLVFAVLEDHYNSVFKGNFNLISCLCAFSFSTFIIGGVIYLILTKGI